MHDLHDLQKGGDTKSGEDGDVWVGLAAEVAPGGQPDGCREAHLRGLWRELQTPTIAPDLV